MATLTQDVNSAQELKMEYPVHSEVSPHKMIPEETREEREVHSDVLPQNTKRVQKTKGPLRMEDAVPDSTFGNLSPWNLRDRRWTRRYVLEAGLRNLR